MQQLFMVTTFRYAILNVDDHYLRLNGVEKYSFNDDNLLHQLQVMYTYLTLSDKKYFKPDNFCRAFKANPKVQQDSQEFYNEFCDRIEKLLKNQKYKYIINDIFTGQTCNTITCNSCKSFSNKFEDFYNLQLEIKGIKNLNESLNNFIISETIDDYRCEACRELVKIQKRTTLYKLPNTLIVHLKRFSMNYDLNTTEKLNSKFEFPLEINLKKFCIENFQNQSNEIYFKNEDYYKYVLKGINVHIGHAQSGHYISFIEVNRDGKGNKMNIPKKNEKLTWLEFNDTTIKPFNINDLPKECYGDNSKCAYLLIYEKIKKTPIKIVIDSKNISKEDENNIINFKKEELNSIYGKYDINKINAQIKEDDLYNKIFHTTDNNEYYKYIQYYNIPKNVPKKLYYQVMNDNISFNKEENLNNNNENINKNIFESFENMFISYFLKN